MKKIGIFLTLTLFLFSSCNSIQDEFQDIKKQRKKRILTVMKQQLGTSDGTPKQKADLLEKINKELKQIKMSK
jgi:hypothetical protein